MIDPAGQDFSRLERRAPLADIRKVITAGLPQVGSTSEGLVPYSNESKKVLELVKPEVEAHLLSLLVKGT